MPLLLENMFNHLSATESLPVFILPENTFTCIILGYVVHVSSRALWQKNVSTILILGFSHSLVQFMQLKGSWFGLKYNISSLFRHPQYPHFSMFTVIILIELDPVFLSVLCSPWQGHQYLSHKQACWNPKIFEFARFTARYSIYVLLFWPLFFFLVWFLKNFDQSFKFLND